jgi:very-short-patch-repair endonuclease
MGEPRWPFIGAEALEQRLLPERVMRTLYQPVYPGVYAPWGLTLTAAQRAEAAWLWSRRRGVVAGSSAAALLGARWVDAKEPAEILHDNRHPPPGLTVRTERLASSEITTVGGIAVTTAARTGFDIGRHTASRLKAVQRLDALAHATDVKVVDIEAVMLAQPRARGLPRLRRILGLVDGGAESPQESYARLVLIDAGLPAPRTQVVVANAYGDFVARIDMGYDDVLVGIEYDGPQHWTDPAVRQRDIDRAVELRDLGWDIVRVSRDLLKYRRATYIQRVANALRARGRL